MTKNEKLKSDIIASIDVIKNLKSSDNIKVRESYINLTNRFRSLEEKDFQTKWSYEIYLKSLQCPKEEYEHQIKALTNQDEYATSYNFFQITMTMLSYLDWIN
ncbi:hypothetical protein ACEN2I_15295 [Flavobacterium sp. W22_SRS_FK3]|uniref:hypothetical protein n=1 Tax=Flavobacterium sp. W22_SRS_FK3 TaxID=3240275 RepID=UPI003F8FA14A